MLFFCCGQMVCCMLHLLPIPLLPRVLCKVRQDKASLIVIAPPCPHKYWLSQLLDLSVSAPLLLPLRTDVVLQNHSCLLHPNLKALHLLACSREMQKVLLNNEKPSLMSTYPTKWKRFSIWLKLKEVSLALVSIQHMLNNLLHLNHQGLVIKVHLDAISAFHPLMDDYSVFQI